MMAPLTPIFIKEQKINSRQIFRSRPEKACRDIGRSFGPPIDQSVGRFSEELGFVAAVLKPSNSPKALKVSLALFLSWKIKNSALTFPKNPN
jgi:hypothetical protein